MASSHSYAVRAEVALFPQPGGWHYLPVPTDTSDELQAFAERGLVPITATLGSTTWRTSLLPKGDGTQFIALNAKVRTREGIADGDTVEVTFTLRG